MKKVVDAFLALAAVIPGLDHVDVLMLSDGRPWLQIQTKTDEAAVAIANVLGMHLESTSISNGTHWLLADADDAERCIRISGPHHKSVRAVSDDEVGAALEQAEEAVRQ